MMHRLVEQTNWHWMQNIHIEHIKNVDLVEIYKKSYSQIFPNLKKISDTYLNLLNKRIISALMEKNHRTIIR